MLVFVVKAAIFTSFNSLLQIVATYIFAFYMFAFSHVEHI